MGFYVDPEMRRRLGEAQKGRTPHNKGVPVSEAQSAKLVAAWEVRRARPVDPALREKGRLNAAKRWDSKAEKVE